MPSMSYLALPGIGLLVGIGLLTWLLASRTSSRAVTTALVAMVLVSLSATFATRDLSAALSRAEVKVLIVFAVVLMVATGKAMWSLGPSGELYRGTVSRTLEVGDRSDSRIPYHVVQLVANGTDPNSARGRANFLPGRSPTEAQWPGWRSPLVLVTGATVPVEKPEQAWLPFDPQGFAAYRIAMMAMGLTSLLAMYGLIVAVTSSPQAGLSGALLGALTLRRARDPTSPRGPSS